MNPRRREMQVRKSSLDDNLVRALGWFSIGLGLAEALMPSAASRASGMKSSGRLMRAYGAREIANGIGMLAAKDPAPWVWARVAGDAVDLTTLAARGAGSRSIVAFVTLAGVTALDIACASRLTSRKHSSMRTVTRDYSDRSGFPESPERMRGAARSELKRALPGI